MKTYIHTPKNKQKPVCSVLSDSGFSHNHPKLEIFQMSFNRWIDKQTGNFHRTEHYLACIAQSNNIDESQMYYGKQEKETQNTTYSIIALPDILKK